MQTLKSISFKNVLLESGKTTSCKLSYQLFGRTLGEAPIVLVNHALTGNSNVSGENGWWNDLIGSEKPIDTNQYTILAFNIPGNGYDGFIIEEYKNWIARDVARLFLKGLEHLQITQLFAIIGGSLGGGIGWEMLSLHSSITKHFIPIATDWRSTDWVIANCLIQEQFLLNSSKPIHDARMHAMLCYRTPASFKSRFNRTKTDNQELFNIESWLLHHGKKLQDRFQLASYKLMNHLLKTIDITQEGKLPLENLYKTAATIHIVGVDTDLFFVSEENKNTVTFLSKQKKNVFYHEVTSIHGHDAFLIEFEKLEKIIAPIFNA